MADAKQDAQRNRSAADEARAALAVRMQELEEARRTTAELRDELREAAVQARNDLDSLERKMEVKAEVGGVVHAPTGTLGLGHGRGR